MSSVRLAFLISLLLHLVGVFLVAPHWQEEIETRAFRARLTYRPRFEPPPRLPVASIYVPAVQMEYLAPKRSAPEVAAMDPGLPPPLPRTEAEPPVFVVPPSGPEFKPTSPKLALETRPSPTRRGNVDSLESQPK